MTIIYKKAFGSGAGTLARHVHSLIIRSDREDSGRWGYGSTDYSPSMISIISRCGIWTYASETSSKSLVGSTFPDRKLTALSYTSKSPGPGPDPDSSSSIRPRIWSMYLKKTRTQNARTHAKRNEEGGRGGGGGGGRREIKLIE